MTARENSSRCLCCLPSPLLLWSTLSSQRVECAVTVTFGGSQNSAVPSAASEPDAAREAQTVPAGRWQPG